MFDSGDLRIEAAVARASARYRTEEAFTPGLQILIPLRGAFIWELGSTESIVTANHTLFIGAGEVSRDRFLDPHPVEYLLITPNLDRFECASAACAGRITPSTTQIQRAASALWSDADESIEETALQLLHDVLPIGSHGFRTKQSSSAQLVASAKELIGSGRERLSLGSLAKQLEVSCSYLAEIFHRIEGETIARYQRKLRLARALIELPAADDLTSLALELGFSSHAHFSTAFRTTYGETPSAYRARMRKRRRTRRI